MVQKELNYENVNGVMLTLTTRSREESPDSVQFTISFKNYKNKSYWSKASLAFAILFNIIALTYVHISLTAILLIISVLGFLLLFWLTHSVQTETLLVIPTVGIQSSIKYIYGKEVYFIPWPSVDDVIINEVIQLNRVLYYLTVIMKESDNIKLIPLFKCTKPRLPMLEAIYSEIQHILKKFQLESDTDKASGDKG